MLIKPTVYMNESGRTVSNVCTYFDIKSDEIMVIHDELDLVPGTAKIQFGGGAAGHNGVLIFTNPSEIKSSKGYV